MFRCYSISVGTGCVCDYNVAWMVLSYYRNQTRWVSQGMKGRKKGRNEGGLGRVEVPGVSWFREDGACCW